MKTHLIAAIAALMIAPLGYADGCGGGKKDKEKEGKDCEKSELCVDVIADCGKEGKDCGKKKEDCEKEDCSYKLDGCGKEKDCGKKKKDCEEEECE